MKNLFTTLLILAVGLSFAQNNPNPGYWQQHVDYKMEVDMDVKAYQYKGKQTLVYTNNSSDTLKRVYFHLFNNAFQPGSAMDTRLQTIKDPDGRMVTKIKQGDKEIKQSRISTLKPNEIGFLHVLNLKQDGQVVKNREVGTILEVTLSDPLLPKQKTTFTSDFEGQVPVQIRRSGRNNKEGVELSMAQWYPKMAEYDNDGWQADPYIAREFHGVWGNFDVKISIDKAFTLGSTGYLQNQNEVGKGYEDLGVIVTTPKKTKKITWHFIAPNVHDFTWGADKNYLHDIYEGPNGVKLHFLYKNNPKIIENWKKLQPNTAKLMEIFNSTVGNYPYKQYSVIQGGDGGMEYAMCTLVLGEGEIDGLTGLIAHEMGHSWFQHVLATNEAKHGWMDEGMTTWLENYGMNELMKTKLANPHEDSYKNYAFMAKTLREMPQCVHADRFEENRVYSISSYSKGNVFLTQLEYIIGKANFMKTMKKYYSDYKFTHPTPTDFIHTAEKITSANLNWYMNEWTQTTNTIDYAIKDVVETNSKTTITLQRIGNMPMPIDVEVEYIDGKKEIIYIPNALLRWEKPNETALARQVLFPWDWASLSYSFDLNANKSNIKSIVIDPSNLLADIKKEDNIFPKK
jgi:hypothetical protein